MSAPQHTPGPWAVNARHISEVEAPNGLTVASCWHEHAVGLTVLLCDVNPVSLAESAANARLIAAAPELLKALERLMPTNVCLTNRNIPDSTVVPLEMDVTMGELRALAALIADARGGAA